MRTAGGRCVRKWRFSNEETAFAVVQKIFCWIFNGGVVTKNSDLIKRKMVVLYQNAIGKSHEKQGYYSKIFRAARANLLSILKEKA